MQAASICFSARLRRAARLAGRIYDEALADTGITVAQYALLRSIERLPDDAGITELAEATTLDPSTLGRNLKVLGRMGLVRSRPGADRRTRLPALSEDGAALLARARPRWKAAQDRLDARIGPGGRAALFDLLDRLADDAARRPDPIGQEQPQ